MSSISHEELRKLCKLARLNPELENLDGLAQHFEKMLSYMDELRSLDLAEVEPLIRLDEIEGHLRVDVAAQSLAHEQTFANAPQEEFNHFAIPKVIGG